MQLAKVVLMAFVYLVRTSLMNCTSALEEAILMDFAPKSARARWKSLENVTTFGWCGSAALGGYIADRFDYSTTFLATAALQAAGTLIFSSLYFIIPKDLDIERGAEASDSHSRAPAAASRMVVGVAAADDVLVEPLPSGSIQQQSQGQTMGQTNFSG